MPKKIILYACDLCGKSFEHLVSAEECERLPIQNRKAEIGEIVRILSGEGKGLLATVKYTRVLEPGWGPGSMYDHTWAVSVDITEPGGKYIGSRFLTFDTYEKDEE